jgi:hypothetical protein
MLVLVYVQSTDYASSQLSGKMTTTRNSEGECITVICIDDKPCETITSNSNNSTDLRDLLENKTKVTFRSQDIV